ncbi:hypothetical protein BHM03_00019412 [Ensete ventricosum]|nr:hypothetical protein BHM03_00019412 [Ensete ventricosum]
MAGEGYGDDYNFLEEETRAMIVMMGGRGWEQKAGAAGERRRHLVWAAREGREMTGMADDGGREERNRAWAGMADDRREERNRGGQRRKRHLRERAVATCGYYDRKGGKEDYNNGKQRLRRGGRSGSKDDKGGWAALEGAVTPVLDLQASRVSKAKEAVKAAAGRFGR